MSPRTSGPTFRLITGVDCETITPKDFLAEWPVQVCDYRQEVDEIMTEEPVRYTMPRDSCAKVFPTNAPVTEIVSDLATREPSKKADVNTGSTVGHC